MLNKKNVLYELQVKEKEQTSEKTWGKKTLVKLEEWGNSLSLVSLTEIMSTLYCVYTYKEKVPRANKFEFL